MLLALRCRTRLEHRTSLSHVMHVMHVHTCMYTYVPVADARKCRNASRSILTNRSCERGSRYSRAIIVHYSLISLEIYIARRASLFLIDTIVFVSPTREILALLNSKEGYKNLRKSILADFGVALKLQFCVSILPSGRELDD